MTSKPSANSHLLISPSQAQQPLCAFRVPEEWELRPDTDYRLTLTADRAVASQPLRAAVTINVSAEAIDIIKTQTQQTILGVSATPASSP